MKSGYTLAWELWDFDGRDSVVGGGEMLAEGGREAGYVV